MIQTREDGRDVLCELLRRQVYELCEALPAKELRVVADLAWRVPLQPHLKAAVAS